MTMGDDELTDKTGSSLTLTSEDFYDNILAKKAAQKFSVKAFSKFKSRSYINRDSTVDA